MSLCILAAGKTVTLSVAAFTLSWTHSVERTRWQEDWKVTSSSLQVVEARIEGSGAGMEPPEGAVLKEGWWSYAPDVGPQRRVVLAASGATSDGWTLCTVQGCRELGRTAGGPIVLEPCRPDGTSQPR
ncbi:DUF1850 domain-containing protein [Mesorhizobium sp. M7A.F.Ca.CA.001.09.2.1]|uniref:DUF1850 domain-containing protein n=1 Tax=Mesorhizobium ciceri TaxID=39645 RepID=A0AB38TDL4_9HYPH|nr:MULTISPECIES: DUF1850 domain-containing protein [Mesorhizobium]MBZ9717483.1 DUF1850 domain-containing protein [Mesorhizobium sp. AD1-1]MDF3213262.1 DUF1850 domain-containing protein [Mesorhizobium ciceri]RUY65183.1 DUF1850 domain-containing protein [Mesorhizobium sp. M7A.F.Ca.CA.001.05.1.1]RUY72271.1 DUF1850 domain-containing protein [Mesorhizobium sp. M7A.F.Ca.CA.001.13.1.1]RUY79696.1 DUF1850 domain-containing protein [Mesorhizobium sp. M7A.F.Ca.CA.001.09.2.1]